MPREFFVGGNFKMNGTLSSLTSLVQGFAQATVPPSVEVVIAPPSIYLLPLHQILSSAKSPVQIAAQNAYNIPSGAFTGEVSLKMLKDNDIPWVILGHSERRQYFHETSELVAQRVQSAIKEGVKPILCIGETLEEREANKTADVVLGQLQAVIDLLPKEEDWKSVVIAYEPVWAIGTGKVATPEQAQEVHALIRNALGKVGEKVKEETRIIYGGSVNNDNCAKLRQKEDIDGFLVGGASLKPDFTGIWYAGQEKLTRL
ncbi:putative TPI1-triose-phosphate isomerase [Atractiella rhizophila]|nr:putative TPI1-triose-phosphate isomerase [Atractiella rhizophila]